MATQVQNRRGTTAEHSTFTGAVGELTVDITKDTVVVHDGSTAGGFPLLKEAAIGSTVQAHDANTAKYNATIANFTGTLQNGGSNVLVASNLGTTVQGYDADLAALAALSTTGLISRTGAGTASTVTAPSGDLVGTTATQTLTNKTLTDPAIIGTILEDVYTISDGAAFEIDPGNGSIQLITLGANRTPKATNFAAGEAVTLMVDDGSAYTLTWSDTTLGTSGVVWKTGGGNAPTLNTTGFTVITFWKVGTQVYGARVGDA